MEIDDRETPEHIKHEKSIIFIIFLAFLAALGIKLFLFDIMIVRGASMEPTLRSGSVIVLNRLAYGVRFPWASDYLIRWKIPEKNEIIVFISPAGSLAIKRCIYREAGDYIFVQGDNAEASYDSRQYGPIPIAFVIGRVEGVR